MKFKSLIGLFHRFSAAEFFERTGSSRCRCRRRQNRNWWDFKWNLKLLERVNELSSSGDWNSIYLLRIIIRHRTAMPHEVCACVWRGYGFISSTTEVCKNHLIPADFVRIRKKPHLRFEYGHFPLIIIICALRKLAVKNVDAFNCVWLRIAGMQCCHSMELCCIERFKNVSH